MYLGAHMSTQGGLCLALDRARTLECESVQLFLKNNLQWPRGRIGPDTAERFRSRCNHFGFKRVFAHAGYLINLASPNPNNRQRSIRALVWELRAAQNLGIPFVVLHPGAHLGSGEETGLKTAAASLNSALNATSDCTVRIALETTAGQGSTIGHKLEHLAELHYLCQHPARLGLCLDTAHLFAAGYQINHQYGWDTFLTHLDKLLGIERILAVHLNDSATPLGSHRDRHTHIGQGMLGLQAFKTIVNEPAFAHLPGCIETPKSSDLAMDAQNLALLRSLRLKHT